MLGLTYGVLAIGVILVFRSSRVINFAIAEMGAFGAVLLARLVINWDVAFWWRSPACVVAGGLIGAAIELASSAACSRRRASSCSSRRSASPRCCSSPSSRSPKSPVHRLPHPDHRELARSATSSGASTILVLVVVPLLTGRARASSSTARSTAPRSAPRPPTPTRRASPAISIKRMSTLVWVLAGVLATVGRSSRAAEQRDRERHRPVRARRPAPGARGRAHRRMVSLPWAVVGGVAIGVAETTLFYNYPEPARPARHGAARRRPRHPPGRSREPRLATPISRALVVLAPGPPDPGPARAPLVGAAASRFSAPLVALIAALVVPLDPDARRRDQFLFSRVLLYALVALSVTVLTGWAGQLSLGQFAHRRASARCRPPRSSARARASASSVLLVAVIGCSSRWSSARPRCGCRACSSRS